MLYWSFEGYEFHWLILLPFFGSIVIGGWMLATHAYQLKARERIIAGTGIGLGVFIFIANILGHWIDPTWAFWVASGTVLLLGVLFRQRNEPLLNRDDLEVWRLILLGIVLILILVWIANGLEIFDDRKNHSIISTIAAGDIPPHFYMNSDLLFAYHYGFQLLAASTVRIGGMLPWSAFDVTKAVVAGLAIVLSYLVGWRLTNRKLGGIVFALFLTFASGSRYLLNFLPQGLLLRAGQSIELIGTGADTGDNLFQAIGMPWAISGGPPVPLPFVYVSGILQPFILGLHAGTGTLMRLFFLLLFLLLPNQRDWRGTVILVAILASFALAAEGAFELVALGVLFVWILGRAWRRSPTWRQQLMLAAIAVVAASLISLVQGGTITELARDVISSLMGSEGGANLGVSDFGFRWPPAIVSAHLGVLEIFQPLELMVALFELGVALVAAPLVTWWAVRSLRRGRFTYAAFAVAAWLGFLVPIFMRYTYDRDVTRFTWFALMTWALLVVPILFVIWRWTEYSLVRVGIVLWSVALIFGGVMLLGSLLTAIPYVRLVDELEPADAMIARRNWDALERGALILDSHPWRATALTGRLTKSTTADYSPLEDWENLIENVSLSDFITAGYGYVLVDQEWYGSMEVAERREFSTPCVVLLDEVEGGGAGGFQRRLYDIRGCGSE